MFNEVRIMIQQVLCEWWHRRIARGSDRITLSFSHPSRSRITMTCSMTSPRTENSTNDSALIRRSRLWCSHSNGTWIRNPEEVRNSKGESVARCTTEDLRSISHWFTTCSAVIIAVNQLCIKFDRIAS
jgi:hypothetical protein